MLEIWTKPASLRPLNLAATLGCFTLCVAGAVTSGCGSDTGGGSGGSGSGGSGSSSSSSSRSSSSSSSSAASSSASGGATSHTVTFTLDTTSKADGINQLALVEANEKVFLVGDFNGWNPQDPKYVMTPVAAKDGFFTITLTFPFDGANGKIDTGASMEYKFAKTTDTLADVWGNGAKDFFVVDAEHPCTKATGETKGLFEWKVNLKLTIPAENTDVPVFVMPAWRDYAETKYGYKTCT
jgi:hypothetical protein